MERLEAAEAKAEEQEAEMAEMRRELDTVKEDLVNAEELGQVKAELDGSIASVARVVGTRGPLSWTQVGTIVFDGSVDGDTTVDIHEFAASGDWVKGSISLQNQRTVSVGSCAGSWALDPNPGHAIHCPITSMQFQFQVEDPSAIPIRANGCPHVRVYISHVGQ